MTVNYVDCGNCGTKRINADINLRCPCCLLPIIFEQDTFEIQFENFRFIGKEY